MLQSHITILVAIGVVMMLITLWSGSDDLVIVTGLIGTFSLALATFGLFNVEIVSNGAVVAAGEYPPVALFTLALALTSFWPALTGPVELIGSATKEDEPFERGGI
jgi:hypothetical protein